MSDDPILVVSPPWVGDTVMTQSLYKILKAQNPHRDIDVLAASWSLPLVSRMCEIRQGIDLPLAHGELALSKRRAIARNIRAQKYGQAIILPRSSKAAWIPFLARIPKRTGYRGEIRFGLINDMRRLDKSVLRTTVQRYVALGKARDTAQPPVIPQPSLSVDYKNQKRLLEQFGLNTTMPVVAMMPGAEYGDAKRWPTERFSELAQHLAGDGYVIWVLGSQKEAALGEQIVAAAGPQVHNLCGRTQLEDVCDLLALTSVSVSNDSGLMHVAGAVGSYVIGIYGSSTPEYTPPLNDNATVIYRNLECSPCFERECPLGHLLCLKGISVDDVEREVRLRL